MGLGLLVGGELVWNSVGDGGFGLLGWCVGRWGLGGGVCGRWGVVGGVRGGWWGVTGLGVAGGEGGVCC